MNQKEVSLYTKFYIELLEEYGANTSFSLNEFDMIAGAKFEDPNEVLLYLARNYMVTPSDRGGVMLRKLDANDIAFHFLPDSDQIYIIAYYLKK